jgi:hypothetical protein
LAAGNNRKRFAVLHWQIGNTALRLIGDDATRLQITPVRAIGKAHAMKKFAAPITLALACIAYGLGVGCAFYFAAQAQGATNVCNPDCLMQKMDALNQKNQALERTVGELALQINKSIRTGRTVTLHTQGGHGGGCLTYIGPSGDQDGFVSWNVSCSRGTLWTIN